MLIHAAVSDAGGFLEFGEAPRDGTVCKDRGTK